MRYEVGSLDTVSIPAYLVRGYSWRDRARHAADQVVPVVDAADTLVDEVGGGPCKRLVAKLVGLDLVIRLRDACAVRGVQTHQVRVGRQREATKLRPLLDVAAVQFVDDAGELRRLQPAEPARRPEPLRSRNERRA